MPRIYSSDVAFMIEDANYEGTHVQVKLQGRLRVPDANHGMVKLEYPDPVPL